jgi:hypothetical protein
MSVGDIIAVVTILINVGKDLYDRIDSIKQADNDLLLLTIHLEVLSNVFKGSENDIILAYSSDFMRMLGILKSIQESYNKCAKILGVEPAEITTVTQKTANGKSVTRRVMIFARIPSILAEIRYKAEQLQKITSILSVSFLSDVRKHQLVASRKESLTSPIAENTALHDTLPDRDVSTGFASIDRMVENLMKECKHLEHQLQENTLYPDTSAVQDYQAQNPEGASFWKDRFQKGQLHASALRYEVTTLKASPTISFPFAMSHIILTCRFLIRCSMFLGRALYMR